MGAYVRDIQKFPDPEGKIQLVYGSKEQRRKQWRNNRAKYFILTYASFLSDAGARGSGSAAGRESIIPEWVHNGSVDGVICDEFHRFFRSRKSKTFGLFKKVFRRVEYFIPMSGSAVNKGPEDIWPALHLCDQVLWSSFWNYVATWCEIEEGWGGVKKISGPKLRNVANWQKLMKQYSFHVTADMIEDMPPKIRDFLEVELPTWQRDAHRQLQHKLFLEVKDDDGVSDFHFAQNPLQKAHKLRLLLICPKAIDSNLGVGQGIEDIADDAQEGGVKQYAVFTPFKAPIPFLAEYLRSRGCRVWILQGGIGLDEQERRLGEWRASLRNASADEPSIILSTIKYAESWEIPEARYGYFLGEEYVMEDNKQAEDRLRRLISVGMTYIRYARFKGTWQDGLIDNLITHGMNVQAMYKDWHALKKILVDQ